MPARFFWLNAYIKHGTAVPYVEGTVIGYIGRIGKALKFNSWVVQWLSDWHEQLKPPVAGLFNDGRHTREVLWQP